MKEVYWKGIKPGCEQADFRSLRVDELKGAFNINRKIIQHIFKCDVIVADLTESNPNVFYEMGVGHTIDNKTIMIIQNKDEVPFDVSSYHCIKYEQTGDGLEILKNRIADSLSCINEWRKEPANPVQEFKPDDAYVQKNVFDKLRTELEGKEKEFDKMRNRAFAAECISKEQQGYLERQKSLVRSLQKELLNLKFKLKEKNTHIKVLQDEADKKKAAESGKITPPPGMVLIPAGEFVMGTSEEQIEKYLKEHRDWKREWLEPEKPDHKVRLDAFFMDAHLVTNAQYALFLNGCGKVNDEDGNELIYQHDWGVHKVNGDWKPQKGFEKHPIINVTWYGARQYAQWADKQLPTEAQWEKAARGGKGLEYATQDGTLNPQLANYSESKIKKTMPVGQYPPNPYGLYDMSGNVWEWCYDWYHEEYYKNSPDKNPTGSSKGEYRISRGGSWSDVALGMRCAYRIETGPWSGLNYVGFRCARAYF